MSASDIWSAHIDSITETVSKLEYEVIWWNTSQNYIKHHENLFKIIELTKKTDEYIAISPTAMTQKYTLETISQNEPFTDL